MKFLYQTITRYLQQNDMKVAVGLIFCSLLFVPQKDPQKIFDVHIHGQKDIQKQLQALESAGVYKAAISTSCELQNSYRGKSK